MQPLPLFPLPSVLVPGLVLPLNVFEPRYRALARHLLDTPPERRVFGVVALRPGRDVRQGADAVHEVGCTAVVRDITELDDGRFEMVTSGALRFRLHGLDDTTGTPWATGLVTPLEDPEGDPDEAAALGARVAAAFTAYRARLGGAEDAVGVTSPRVLSHLVTAGMVLPLPERQALLEQPDAVARLRAQLRLLAREEALLDATGALPQTGPDLSFATPN
ncbi:LON peptidase substrate-binding domain-containing protein [uncultured Pseudokineococcus sp.]|uniref:LON peptidase substrate-binding domain-containing protein n=1 Tax=uncultured Pseudokineococcus sp. TaxID=1642928 RepID=UPI002635858A|nr:LON peptidase substrate-binding domain-containing protein [uncultured Pseudokineococcus sp.]